MILGIEWLKLLSKKLKRKNTSKTNPPRIFHWNTRYINYKCSFFEFDNNLTIRDKSSKECISFTHIYRGRDKSINIYDLFTDIKYEPGLMIGWYKYKDTLYIGFKDKGYYYINLNRSKVDKKKYWKFSKFDKEI